LQCAHIVPVGTSLLGNFARSSEGSSVVRGFGVDGWDRFSPDDPRQEVVCGSFDALKGYLLDFVRSAGDVASAELSSLLRAVRGLGCDPSFTHVILYATNTCTSRLSMSVIAGYLRELGFIVREHVIPSARSEDELETAMREVVDRAISEALKMTEKGYHVCVNATPGFKVESAYLTVAALLAGLDCIYYMHEAFRDVVYMPVPPLQLKEDYRRAILELEKPLTRGEAERRLGRTLLEELIWRRLVEEESGAVKARQWILRVAKIA
jgi:putative CRISPR-associated protein (TIGR02619 family)